jgi:hypothetical protein
MVGNYQVAIKLVATRVVLGSIELFSKFELFIIADSNEFKTRS